MNINTASTTTAVKNRWVAATPLGAPRRIRLFCLPYAGGGASTYMKWQRLVLPEVEVCPVRLPGRESRMSDPFITDARSMVEALASGLAHCLGEPYAFFGHSMGGLLAYEVTCELRARRLPLPKCLFISARPAPHTAPRLLSKPVAELSDRDFIQEVGESMNASALELFSQPELMAMILPIMRSDFQLCEGFRFVPREPLNVPIWALGGDADTSVSESSLRSWSAYTDAGFLLEMIKGGHFFLNDSADVIQIVNRQIRRLLTPGTA